MKNVYVTLQYSAKQECRTEQVSLLDTRIIANSHGTCGEVLRYREARGSENAEVCNTYAVTHLRYVTHASAVSLAGDIIDGECKSISGETIVNLQLHYAELVAGSRKVTPPPSPAKQRTRSYRWRRPSSTNASPAQLYGRIRSLLVNSPNHRITSNRVLGGWLDEYADSVDWDGWRWGMGGKALQTHGCSETLEF